MQRHGATVYLLSDCQIVDANTEWWTTDLDKVQVYYDQEVAFGKAGILSSLIDAPVEVVALDR
jgi:hypothetical protein